MTFRSLIKHGLTALLLLGPLEALADTAMAPEVTQRQTHDFTFIAKRPVDTGLERSLVARLTHTDTGTTYSVHGFYNGEQQFVVRTAPPLAGEWRMPLSSDIPSLDATQLQFSVRASHQRGVVRVDNGTHRTFKYDNGDVYTPSAYELDWLVHLDNNSPKLTQSTSIVSFLQAAGFNQVLMNVYAYGATNKEAFQSDAISPRYNFNEPDAFPFGGSNDSPDHSRLNIEYFKQLDKKIELLQQFGIQSHLMIFVWNKNVSWPTLNSEAELQYFDYVIKRYSGYTNIIWDVSKEAMDYGHANAQFINDRIDRIRRLDGHKHLITLHDFIYAQSPFLAANIDYISIQEWAPNIGEKTSELHRLHPKKPIHNVENGCYETTQHAIFSGAYSSSESCLDRNYRIYFNGAFTTHYWQNTSWFELNYEPLKLPKKKQPNTLYLKVFNRFIQQYPLTDWRPAQFHFTSWALLKDNDDLVFYLQDDGDAVRGHLTPSFRNHRYAAKWIATHTGQEYPVAEVAMNGYIWLDAKKPSALIGQPALLVLTRLPHTQTH